MTFKNFSSRPPVANSEIADTPLSGGEVARQRGEKVARILCGMNGLLIFVALCFVGHAVYCAVLESKLKAIVAPEFRLESATISLHEVNSKYTAVDWEVKLVAINPNTDIGLHCHDSSLATVNFYGYENFRATVARGLLPDFFINNATQNVISFKLGMVTRSNDRMVSKTVEQLRRAPRSVTTLFGFEINILYSFDNKKMCSVNCRRTKEYFWEPATFQSNGI